MDTRSGFHHALQELQSELMQYGRDAENQIRKSVQALADKDVQGAREIVERDDQLDAMLLRIEERCVRLIALQQPMAGDLRIIGTALKIAIDIERIADHAVDIAKVTIRLGDEERVKPLVDIPKMAELATDMLREALSSYTERSVHLASSLTEKEEEVDKLYSKVMTDVVSLMGADRIVNRQLTHLLMVAQYLERVADHATNIGEGVIYMTTGKRKDLNP